jgi:hypothetical protein
MGGYTLSFCGVEVRKKRYRTRHPGLVPGSPSEWALLLREIPGQARDDNVHVIHAFPFSLPILIKNNTYL